MRGTRWAAVVAGVGAVALLGTGCGAVGAGEKAGSVGFGREAAQGEIRAAVAGAGLPESDLPEPGEASPTASAGSERERLAQRAAACTAAWQYVGPTLDGARGKFDRTLTALVEESWKTGNRQVEKLDEKGGTSVAVTLRKRGWTLMARHHASKTVVMDVVSFQATEDVCMSRFTERETELLFGDDEGDGKGDGKG
ncbi:hypothetical protein AQF52_2423 [Streptomyces venezuelae]|uniref:hypothetical protein n=1 Tax=Streptomyces gardneri TaxID=66892 RepID=UPI0006BDBD08|nr:hypothetical protein [Streptomyces gardneri]ALO08018.1 hypothetical protein AQF52_2423 [Streptomyces venezuelae]QPK45296.1 hypothetical protein H4W23_12055 [Streptomyces gardneri]WRK36618.1 hypothetical protein U0M97_12110 [Streptomyces venezuelae]CUM41639.1 hypothetical protein BN2537_12243 [Streptomyces venezuelae]